MNRYFAIGVLALAVTTGVACGEPAPTPTPAPELAVAPTATPTVTPTPTQKPTPTPTPLQTFTPSPSPTATPIPVVAAQPSLEVQSLSNGLKVIVYEDHTAPVVSVNVWYRVGSRNELVGNRGLAHLMEHMMFKGSTNFGPDEHAQIIDRAGGVGNAFTSEDATGYWDKVPLEKFELALELEAERMHNLVLTQENLDSEREVVKEEFRTRIENDPISAAFETFRALAFEGTPYAWAPVGTLDDIDGITLSDLSNFYETYYAPNNAVLVVAGDVTAEGVFELAQEHFGAIPRAMAPPILSVELAEQAGFREETLEMAVQLPAVIGGYTIPGVGHEDLPALEVIQFILSAGESSRMNRSLVREQRLAVFAGGFALTFKDLGSMLIVAFFTPDKDPTQIKDALLGEIERLRTEPVAQEELQKAKNQLTAQYIFNLDSLSGVADSIGEAEVVWGDYRLFLEAQERYNDLSVADIQDVAQRYFIDEGLTLVTLKPEQETQP